METPITPSDYLYAWRSKRELSRKDAGALVGVTARTWEAWETKWRTPPQMLWVLLPFIEGELRSGK